MVNPHFSAHSRGSEHELPSIQVKDPFTLMIFGGTGDLTRRKLMPGLFAMYKHELLASEFAVVGSGRSDYTDQSYRERIEESIRKFSRVEVEEQVLQDFLSRVYYVQADVTSDACYEAIEKRYRTEEIFPDNRIFYLSVKPALFAPIVSHLQAAGLTYPMGGPCWSRVVIEKPFGNDLESARALNEEILSCLDEQQIYRIDHYLGKETVQNILSFRLANAVFEPLLNHHYVDHIQIMGSETVGMEGGRGGYYDTSGAVRDMLQNHLLQLLCLVTMDPPADFTSFSIHNEKVKVLRAIEPIRGESVKSRAVRAQYVGNILEGQSVPGYLEEEQVRPGSVTETYAALRLYIQNWRWSGVPIYLRTGKQMPERKTEVRIQFKNPPLKLFQTVECEGDVCDFSDTEPNCLVFRIQPEEGISMSLAAKRPGLQVQVENVDMDFSYKETWDHDLPEAYERLLLDVMRGDSTLFMRSDEVEAAWAVVDPLLKAWGEDADIPVYHYKAGTWGPEQADSLFINPKNKWRD